MIPFNKQEKIKEISKCLQWLYIGDVISNVYLPVSIFSPTHIY